MNTSLQILLSIALIIIAAKLAGALVGRMGLPVVLGELLAGVLLFRLLYYVVPFAISLLILGVRELWLGVAPKS